MKNRGVALVVVLWISAILTLLVYSFLRTMLVEYSLTNGLAEQKQAEQVALSCMEKAIALIEADETVEATLMEDWSDNEEEFFESKVGTGFFTMSRPTYEEEPVRYYGAIDEASKININVANKATLMKIPNMTEEIADSILDWRDEDEEPRQSGAESTYYLMQNQGYNCKNQAFETVEELLFVKNITPKVLWGDDENRNGIEDEFEGEDSDFDYGLAAYVTVWSHEPNTDAEGEKRININTASQQDLQQRLGEDLDSIDIQAIMLVRQAQQNGFQSVAHLLDIPTIDKQKFKKVVDKVTILADEVEDVPGLINVNTAPRKVLEAVPGMKPENIEKIMQQRTVQGTDLSNIGWLTDVLENDDLKAIANAITCRSFQFRFDVLGVVKPETAAITRRPVIRRIMAVYDRIQDPAQLIYWKDWSPFGLSYEIVEEEEQR